MRKTRAALPLVILFAVLFSSAGIATAAEAKKPNLVLVLVDNLGWGELGSYGGGVLRGAPTPRLDKLATEGFRLTNFNVETECVPTRAALLTGRHPLRSGTLRSLPPGEPQGLVRWEVTLAELLSAQGYATAHYGKWHLGDAEGRLPTDRGFDEWYGIPRTDNEALYTTGIGYDPKAAPIPYILEGRKGEKTRNVEVFDVKSRARLDAEVTKRTLAFIERNARDGRPFFAYVPITQVHFPTLPHPDFKGRTGLGDFADAVVEMDFRMGEILDGIEKAGIVDNTIFIFASDNGPELRRPYRGFAGPWRSHYHTAFEGGIRTPFIIRWPGKIPAGRVSNEIVHVMDIFPTLAKIAGAPLPTDRAIDGVRRSSCLANGRNQSRGVPDIRGWQSSGREMARLEATLLVAIGAAERKRCLGRNQARSTVPFQFADRSARGHRRSYREQLGCCAGFPDDQGVPSKPQEVSADHARHA
jgi:arylsulfatase